MSSEPPLTATTITDPSALIDASPDIVSLVDREGTWRVVGGAVERLLGFSVAALAGVARAELVHPDDEAALDRTLAAARARLGGLRERRSPSPSG